MEPIRNKDIFLEEQEENYQEALVYLQAEEDEKEEEFWAEYKPEGIVELITHPNINNKGEKDEENKLPF